MAVSEGVGKDIRGLAVSTVMVSPSLSVNALAIRTVFGLVLGIVGNAVRLLKDGEEPKDRTDCRSGMVMFDTIVKERWRSDARCVEGTRASTRQCRSGELLEYPRALQNTKEI